MKLVVATGNRNKVREIADKYAGMRGVELLGLDSFPGMPEVIEDGESFRENALKKALAVVKHTGGAAMADDSGLAVDALQGRPGIYSARYGGPGLNDADRNRRLLDEMVLVPDGGRTARFICVIVIALPDGSVFTAEGSCEGSIAREPRGDGGFGYDPVFIPAGRTITMAQIPLEEKNRISHRALALDQARGIISSLTNP